MSTKHPPKSRFMMEVWRSFYRECRRISHSRWDMFGVFGIPLLVVVLFGSMFIHTKAEHLPIMIIDRDHSELSATIIDHARANQQLEVIAVISDQATVEQAINTLEIGGYLYIPHRAQYRLVNGEDPQIQLVYNQALFTMATRISTALRSAVLTGMQAFISESYLVNILPKFEVPLPTIKTVVLFNPNLSYELFLSPFVLTAVLHLLLSCQVAYAVGIEFADDTISSWLTKAPMAALIGKIMPYLLSICLWTWLWLMWMVWVRDYAVMGSIGWLLSGQVVFYLAYAFFGALIALAVRSATKSFGILAVYGGSSMSFAGVTLPLNNASGFTQFWSHILPFSSYAQLQTQSWIIASPWQAMLPNLLNLLIFFMLFVGLCMLLLKKRTPHIALSSDAYD